MGNVSGREDGEGTSGAKKNGYEGDNDQSNLDPMLHSPPHSPNDTYQLPFLFPPQIPMFPWLRSAEMMQAQNDVLLQNTSHYEDLNGGNNLPWQYNHSDRALDSQIPEAPLHFFPQIPEAPLQSATDYEDVQQEEKRAVMITWCYGGKQVAITGSWDNWRTIEPLHSLGKDFIIMKLLPPGVYHYHFIVDELMRYAPNLPWKFDESGNPYNILDLQEFDQEAPKRLSEFDSPPSPVSSYDNQPLTDGDFSKPPPELPPQLRKTFIDEQSFVTRSRKCSPRPNHTMLNHLYKQDGDDGQSVALCSIHRFRQKCVTAVLYKSLYR
ncbi:hypothetical protein COLO4_33328 [Corchorus olitorius]|uniref:Association with the SNF1 complex (ASC) domain-containing protein n=1 Tax=Corchorus olitorius TaxID=93759 RepID=A0A1R3GUM4_9ROSI|nr:hypothetical protein COLO4_33328 [Corchorus olitorius]